jgi:KamA family protein
VSPPVRYVRDLAQAPGIDALSPEARRHLEAVAEKYKFRANDYYLGLVDWSDPADPIRRIVVPDAGEAAEWGKLDASNEAANTVQGGVQHKYVQTVLRLVNEVCGAYCRYCFRKRLFMDGNDETSMDVEPGCRYVESHPEVTNVLLTGGDPLILGTKRLDAILDRLRRIDHVRIIRIGSKMPAFNPFRVLDDPTLVESLARHGRPDRRIYLMAHFDHPRELTPEALEGLDRLMRAGVIVVNQCPLLAGINDDPAVLTDLFRRLSFAGAPQYYLFQGRPTAGNLPYRVPIVRGWHIFQEAQRGISGLAKRARYVMSHESGKIEVLAVTDDRILMRYHRAKNPADRGRLLWFRRDDEAAWLDELVAWDTVVPAETAAVRGADGPE